MSKFKISILKAFKDKLIEAEMESMVIKGNNLVSLMKAVGEEGCVFCPSTFKDSIKSRETFEQSQLFVLTFGNANNEGLSFIKIKSRARYYGLPMLFAYITDPFYCIDVTREQLSIAFADRLRSTIPGLEPLYH